MARVRGGNTGFAVALVIFGCGFVISLLVAVIFYTRIEEAKSGQTTAEANLREFISSGETAQANEFKSPNSTVFQAMLTRVRDLEAAQLDKDGRIAELEGETRRMETQFGTLNGQMRTLEDQLEAERRSAAQTLEERKTRVDTALQENADLQASLADMQQKLNDALKNADQAAQDRISELSTQVKDVEGQLFDANRRADEVERQMTLLRESLPTPLPAGTTGPDAEIASIFGDGNDLFITVGKRDGVVMGMTFEVFDPQPVIRLNEEGEARGKATVEVYSIKDDSATCRVVRRDRGESINTGDPVVNIAYDPNITVRMFPFGSFDIEYDGGSNDIGRIQSLIQESGAELVDVSRTEAGVPILTPDIHYIVLGAKPELPEQPSADTFDPVIIAEYQRLLAANEAYFNIVEEAKLLQIPVLSQDRFLQLVGYYER